MEICLGRGSVDARAYLCQSVGGEKSRVFQFDLEGGAGTNPSSANLPAVET